MVALHVLGFIIPAMSLLRFVDLEMLSCCDKPVHDSPFGYGRTVDTGTGRNGDSAFFQDRMAHEMVKASRKCMNEFEARSNIISQFKVNKDPA